MYGQGERLVDCSSQGRSVIMSRYLLRGLAIFLLCRGTLPPAQAEELVTELRRAEAELRSGAYADARKRARKLTQQVPEQAQAWLILGRANTFLGKYEDALAAFEKASTLGVTTTTDVGIVYFKAGQNKKALRTLARALVSDPKDSQAHYFLGLAKLKAEDYAGARESLTTARELDEDLTPDALYFAALAALKQGDRKTAVAELQRAVEFDPESTGGKAAQILLDRLAGRRDTISGSLEVRNEYDSNVLLVPLSAGLFEQTEASRRRGDRFVFAGDIAWRPALGGDLRGKVGYGLYQSWHVNDRSVLRRFNVTHHNGTAGLTWQAAPNHTLTLPYDFSLAYLGAGSGDYQRYSLSHSVSPAYGWQAGAHAAGLVEALGYENFDRDLPAVTVDSRQLEQSRDNVFSHTTGYYQWSFANGRGFVSPLVTLSLVNAKGSPNSWDYTGARLGLRMDLPLGKTWRLQLDGSIASRSYGAPYPIVADTGVISVQDRQDSEYLWTSHLAYEGEVLTFSLGATGVRNRSTVALFDYNRFITSVALGLRW